MPLSPHKYWTKTLLKAKIYGENIKKEVDNGLQTMVGNMAEHLCYDELQATDLQQLPICGHTVYFAALG